MSSFSVKEQNAFYRRELNTYHYQISSQNCTGPERRAGLFEFDIPPYPYPTHQASQLALFKLKDFWIVNQGSKNTQRASQSATDDISVFTLDIKGLGTRSSVYSNTGARLDGAGNPNAKQLFPSTKIEVVNKYGGVNLTGTMQAVSGSDETDFECVVSNPAGSHLRVQVLDGDKASQIADGEAGTYFCILRFSIEVLDPEISSGNI